MAFTSAPTAPAGQENYLFKITLEDVRNPQITRTLSCPADASFHEFHQAMIISFGWAATHEYNFQIFDKGARNGSEGFGPRPVAAISDWEPEDFPLIGITAPPKTTWQDASKIKLHEYMAVPSYQDKHLQYEYDFEHGWEHAITFLGRVPSTGKFLCVDGEGHGAAEDAGGPFGWEELKEAYKTENPSQGQKEKMWWYEGFCTNGYNTGLGADRAWRWSQERVNEQLARLPEMVWRHDRKLDVCESSTSLALQNDPDEAKGVIKHASAIRANPKGA
ncbi:hypothetical protein N7G274_001064 [Stereocaulon virgatum]|uniref:Plasmid pRiA4b Orf3-like domain-containing protein n=1 Tax=Stereocaulon virgatum TaxID=373712 RepID=A0ABR4AQC8_9LECA